VPDEQGHISDALTATPARVAATVTAAMTFRLVATERAASSRSAPIPAAQATAAMPATV
jgi:hypothetical protein